MRAEMSAMGESPGGRMEWGGVERQVGKSSMRMKRGDK